MPDPSTTPWKVLLALVLAGCSTPRVEPAKPRRRPVIHGSHVKQETPHERGHADYCPGCGFLWTEEPVPTLCGDWYEEHVRRRGGGS